MLGLAMQRNFAGQLAYLLGPLNRRAGETGRTRAKRHTHFPLNSSQG